MSTETEHRLYPTRTVPEIAAELDRLTEGVEPWPAEPWEQYGRETSREMMHRQAARTRYDHGHNMSDTSRLTRENCAACYMDGWKPREGWGDEEVDAVDAGPNVAAWARDFVESRSAVRLSWVGALLDSASFEYDNQAYAEALRRSLATWGVTITTDPQRGTPGTIVLLRWQP